MDDMTTRLAELKTVWLASEQVPDDLTDWGAKPLTKERVGYSLDECGQLASKLQTLDWQGPVALAVFEAEGLISQLSEFVTTRLKEPNPEQSIGAFLTILQQLLLVLRNAAVFSADTVYNAERELLRVTSQIESSKSLLQDLKKIAEDSTTLKTTAESAHSEIVAKQKSAAEAEDRIQAASKIIVPVESQIKEMLKESNENSAAISKETGEISTLNQQYKTLHEQISADEKKLADIQKRCEGQQEEIHKTIQDANRLGMAGSFRMRKNELVRPIVIWGFSFFVGVCALSALALIKILPLLEAQHFDWLALLGRLPLLGPALWWAWFSAKQYAFSSRLWEDYAFRYASAMAFEGYKREASSVSPEMLQLLLEVSIVNFSSNPLRVYDSKNIHASPLNELTNDTRGMLQNLLDIMLRRTKIPE